MHPVYRVLAYLIVGLVAVQAAAHAWASAGIQQYLMSGGVFDPNAAPNFPEFAGILIHAMTGMFVIPLVAIALLVVGFLSRIPGAAVRAGIIVALVAVQVLFGFMGHDMTALAMLHGLNAVVLAGMALYSGLSVGRPINRLATSHDIATAPVTV